MDNEGTPNVAMKKANLTPKAIIYKKFGDKAVYKVEELEESTQDGCPRLARAQKRPPLFRCILQLPEFSVVSETCKRKKDAEQSAAEIALHKLGIHPSMNNPTVQDPWDELVARVSYLFSNEFLPTLNPLSGHFRAVLRREGDLNGSVPISVIASCDSKINNLCKSINPKAESDPLLLTSLIMMNASRLPKSVYASKDQLWVCRKDPYPTEIVQPLITQEESISVQAMHIPYSQEKTVAPLTLKFSSNGYYLDVIAQYLGVTNASRVLLSRTIGKASSEMRFYFAIPEPSMLDSSMDFLNMNEVSNSKGTFNSRASYISGQIISGDAILASVGYMWRSADLFHEDVTPCTYYRLIISKIPGGIFKLSREAVLTSELPLGFITRTNWRGLYPREILCAFCRNHRLSEPVFCTKSNSPFETSQSDKTTVAESALSASGGRSVPIEIKFRCEVKLFSRCQDLILECSPKQFYKRQNDAIQNAALTVLSCLNTSLKDSYMPLNLVDVRFNYENFVKVFSLCRSIHESWAMDLNCRNQIFKIEGPELGSSPSNGSLVCIRYFVYLVIEGGDAKECLESCDEFEFEIGNGAVLPHLEACVIQMFVDQTASFSMELPSKEWILAAAVDSAKILSLLSSKSEGHCLEYNLSLLRIVEPLEERMEQALFSPPLSKQRLEYAMQHIKKSDATSLVDFGCGSGSLLQSILDYPTSLEKIAGVDISQKSLNRAAKVLHTKLSSNSDAIMPSANLKSVLLYEGSITVFDSRMCAFDIGTCLEVIEHMEEDQACLFGDIVLSSFRPKILIVSTPNYEYNVILQRSNPSSHEDDPDEKTQSESCKFRNHDHKFEWTRKQFSHWALELAKRHNYSVEFGGVGGSAELEPGFASQIAVFRRGIQSQVDDCPMNIGLSHCYEVIWEWGCSNSVSSSLW